MKKIVFILMTVTFCTSLYAGDGNTSLDPLDNTTLTKTTAKDITESGFFVHFTLGFPNISYGYPLAFENDDSDYKFGIGPGLQLGNMFKINDVANNAIGVKAVWMSTMYTAFKITINDTLSFNYGALQASALRLGPYFTVAVTDEMALDIFYTVGMSTIIGVNDYWDNYLGLTHNIGVGFRLDVLSLGLDFNFGGIKDLDEFGTDLGADTDLYKVRTTHLRFLVGVKI